MENVTATQIGIFIGCAIVLLTVGALAKSLFTRTPALHAEFVGKEQYAKDQADIKEQQRQQAVSRKAIYGELENQGKQISALQAETAHQTRAIIALDSKIDNLPERILRLVDRKAGS